MSQIFGIEKAYPERTVISVSNSEEMRKLMASESRERRGPGGPGGPGGPSGPRVEPKAAVFVRNGAFVAERTVGATVYGGAADGSHASHLRIVGYDDDAGGVYVEGAATRYSLEDSVISISAPAQGFGGVRSGVGVGDHAEMEVRNCVIMTSGSERSATGVSDYGVLRMYDSVMVTQGAPYGEDAPADRKSATSPPAALEIQGNSRTHCTTAHGKSYFYNCTAVGDGWAVLSTDHSEGHAYLEANDTRVVATKSGYGVYSDKFCHCVLNRCDLDCATMAAILDGEASVKMYDTKATAGEYFAFIHVTGGPPTQVGEFYVDNCHVTCGGDVFSMRGHNVILTMKNSTFHTDHGRLIHTRFNTDNAAPLVKGRTVYGYRVFMEDMSVSGDIIHEDPDREMTVTLTSSNITGSIVNANLTMDRGSSWYATADSTVMLCNCDINMSQIDAPEGVTVRVKGATPAEYQLASGGALIIE